MKEENSIPWEQYSRGQKKLWILFFGVIWLVGNIQLVQLPWWVMIPIGTTANAYLIYVLLGAKNKIAPQG